MENLLRDARMRVHGRTTRVAVGGEAVLTPGGSWFHRESEPSWILHKTRMATKIVTAARNSMAAGAHLDYSDLKEDDYDLENDSIMQMHVDPVSSTSMQRARFMHKKRSGLSLRSTPSRMKPQTPSPSSETEQDDGAPLFRMESVIDMETKGVPTVSAERVQFADRFSALSGKSLASAREKLDAVLQPIQLRLHGHRQKQDQKEALDTLLAQGIESEQIDQVLDSDSDDEFYDDESTTSESAMRLTISRKFSGLRSVSRSTFGPIESKSSKVIVVDTVGLDDLQGMLPEEASSEDTSKRSYEKEMTLNVDLCAQLGMVPDLNEISSTITEDIALPGTTVPEEDLDVGRFVHPLTGMPISTASLDEKQKLIAKASKKSIMSKRSLLSRKSSRRTVIRKKQEGAEGEEDILEVIEEEVEEESSEAREDDELLALIELDDGLDELDRQEQLLQQQQQPEDEIEQFLEADLDKKVVLDDGTNFEMMAEEHAKLKLIEQTVQFLNELIVVVVDTCERVDPLRDIAIKLDKMKIIKEIEKLMSQLEVEQRARFFLNRKVVDHFRRKKIFRAILEDSPEHLAQNMERYREVVAKLDHLMGREQETKTVTDAKIKELEVVYSTEAANTENIIAEFNELVQGTCVRESSKDQERMLGIVNNLLSIMDRLRSEISQVRFMLIQKQHNRSAMLEKLEKLENIGNGLRLRDYEHLQTDTLALGKKIEERNTELARWRTRCEIDFHMIAHMRERQQMLRGSVATQKEAFEQLQREKHTCRRRIYLAKIERGMLRREMQELSFQGGLLDKPALMNDYDETAEAVQKRKKVLDKLNAKYRSLEHRIAHAEKWLREHQNMNEANVKSVEEWRLK